MHSRACQYLGLGWHEGDARWECPRAFEYLTPNVWIQCGCGRACVLLFVFILHAFLRLSLKAAGQKASNALTPTAWLYSKELIVDPNWMWHSKWETLKLRWHWLEWKDNYQRSSEMGEVSEWRCSHTTNLLVHFMQAGKWSLFLRVTMKTSFDRKKWMQGNWMHDLNMNHSLELCLRQVEKMLGVNNCCQAGIFHLMRTINKDQWSFN